MQDQDIPEITPEMLQQNPGLLFMFVLVMLVVFLGGTGSLASWTWILFRWTRNSSVLPLQLPWQPRVWSFVEVVMSLSGIFVVQSIVVGFAYGLFGGDQGDAALLKALAVGGMTSLLAVIFVTVWISIRYGATAKHIGFGSIGWSSLGGGLIAGLAALPIVYIMMMIVSTAFDKEYDHPLITSATESGSLIGYFLGCFAAVIVAPIAEEFAFRVVLQGWLQSLPFKSLANSLIGAQDSNEPAAIAVSGDIIPNSSAADMATLEASVFDSERELTSPSFHPSWQTGAPPAAVNPYEPLTRLEDSRSTDLGSIAASSAPSATVSDAFIPPVWPSVVVGILFGLAHVTAGLSFIPLSFMGILLGLVYRQTHSIWPCILIHAMLNGTSMLMLGLVIMLKQAGA